MDTPQGSTINEVPVPVPAPASNPLMAQPNIGMAILAYLGILVIVPLIVAKNDPFVKFHAKQGLVLLIFDIIVSVFAAIPLLGLVTFILWPIVFILIIIGIINAAGGNMKSLPVIGGFANSFNF